MNEVNEKNPLPTLLTILGIFSGIWYGLFRLLVFLIEKRVSLKSDTEQIILITTLFATYPIFSYLIKVIRAIYYETSIKSLDEVNKNKLLKKRKETYNEVMQTWVKELFFSIFIFLTIIYGKTFGGLGYFFALILGIIVVLEWYFLYLNPYLKKSYQIKNWSNFKFHIFSSPKEFIQDSFKNSFMMFFKFSFYALTIIVLTSGIDVELNQKIYTTNESVVVHIQPYGIIPPSIGFILYSSDETIIYDGLGQPYGASFRLIEIPRDLLTEKTYNSHIRIITYYFKVKKKLWLTDQTLVPIPVYKPLLSENTSTPLGEKVEVNESLLIEKQE